MTGNILRMSVQSSRELSMTHFFLIKSSLTLVTMTTTKFFSSILYSFRRVSSFKILPVTLKKEKECGFYDILLEGDDHITGSQGMELHNKSSNKVTYEKIMLNKI